MKGVDRFVPASHFWAKAWMADALRDSGFDIHIARQEARSFFCTVVRDGVVRVHEGTSRQNALAVAYHMTLRLNKE